MALKRTTIADVARAAGVGVATVDRVINSRKPVREDTAEKVIKAAEQLGYHALSLMRHRIAAKAPKVRLGFVLQKATDPLYQSIAECLRQSIETRLDVRGEAVISFVNDLSPRTIADAIVQMGSRVDAIACVALEHPLIAQAVDRLAAEGKPVFALMSDISAAGRTGYIGLDSRKLGRTGALLIAGMTPRAGKVAIFIGSHRYFGQELAEIGFRSYFRHTSESSTRGSNSSTP